MLRDIRRLAKETAIYGMTTMLGRLLSFLLTPLFTHLLTRTESGVVQTTYSYIAFMTVVYGMGLDVAYLRLGRSRGQKVEGAFSGAWIWIAGVALSVSIVVSVFAARLAALMGIPAQFAAAVRYAAWILAIDAAALMPYTELRGSHKASAYAWIKMVSIALNLALAWALVRNVGLGVRGVFLANLIASAGALVVLTPVLRGSFSRPDWARLREQLALGLPLVAAGLGSMVVQVADRPLMARMRGLAMAGLYGNCYKLGIFMMLIVSMFGQAWKPFVLERSEDKDVDRLIARVLTYFAVVACAAFLGVAFFVNAFVEAPLFAGRSLFHPAYWDGLVIVPIVTLGYLFNGLYYVMLAPLLVDKRMSSVGVATWVGALLNIGTNLVWIPRYGMAGAAWATCVAYGGMAVVVYWLGRKTRAVPYEWPRLLRLAAWTALLWAAGTRVGLLGRAGLAVAYPLGLWFSGFLHQEEAAELRSMLRLA